MKVEKEILRELASSCEGDGFQGYEVLENTLLGTRRWNIDYFLVFSFKNKFYKICYSVGVNGSQDERPFEYDDNLIECLEVRPVEKTIIEYEPI